MAASILATIFLYGILTGLVEMFMTQFVLLMMVEVLYSVLNLAVTVLD